MAELLNQVKGDLVLPSSGRILCCLCGISIIPNPAAMCMTCVTSQADITAGIPTDGEIVLCKKCNRWQVGPDHWVGHELESSGLLSALMRRMPALHDHSLKVIGAAWIWTEPHSKRLKFSVEIEKGVLDDKMTLRQKVIIDYLIKNKQCLDCIHESTDHTWGALLQVRQAGGSRKTFSALEAALTKAKLFHLMLDVTVTKDGLDLYFRAKNQADKVMDFISSMLPVRCKQSKKLVSRDLQSNVSRYEFTAQLEIVPLNRGDLIIASRALLHGSSAELLLVSKVSSLVHAIQPKTLHKVEFSGSKYFSCATSTTLPAVVLATEKQLKAFVILDIIPLPVSSASSEVKEAGGLLAEAVVAREEDMGVNDVTYSITTHLGHLLAPGDTAMGYDLSRVSMALVQDAAIERLSAPLPEVVLVRKHFTDEAEGSGAKGQQRHRKKNNRPPPWLSNRKKVPAASALGAEGEGEESTAAPTDDTVIGEEDEQELQDEEDDEEEDGDDDEDDEEEEEDDEGEVFADSSMIEVI